MSNDELERVDRTLTEFGAALCRREQSSPAEVQAALREFRARLRRERSQSLPVAQRLKFVRVLMEHLCGERATHSAVALAARRTPALTAEALCEEHWNAFLSNLQAVASAIGGKAVGALVWESGQA